MERAKLTLRRAITIILVLAFLASAALGVYSLRQNNLRMLELRDAVFTADRDDGDTGAALSSLQIYVVSHMNTRLPKLGKEKAIQLKYTYERRLAADKARVSAERATISVQGTDYCKSTFPGASFAVRSQCVEEYYAAHPVKSLEIPVELYSYDFVTPFWVPDTAGLSLLATTALFLVLLLKFTSWLIVRRTLKPTV